MSEAIILYRGRGGGVSEEDKRPKVYTNNGVFKAPFTGNYLVSCVGGGGGGGGGCRNIWNSSQVYYGAGGSRGGFSSGNVWLNQGDEVTMTMGPGGSAGTNNTTVVSYNSRGTSGSAGSTTTFGSHRSAAGGSGGDYSWMWRSTYNQKKWTNTVSTWNNTYTWSNTITGYSNSHQVWCKACWEVMRANWRYSNGSYTDIIYDCTNYMCDWYDRFVNYRHKVTYQNYGEKNQSVVNYNSIGVNIKTISTPTWSNKQIWTNTPLTWNNTYVWNNTIHNFHQVCFIAIQTGTWWYLNNNAVSTAGTRAYSGDGGQSGSKGNAGFILIYPQWSE